MPSATTPFPSANKFGTKPSYDTTISFFKSVIIKLIDFLLLVIELGFTNPPILILSSLILSVFLILQSLKENVIYFQSPSEIKDLSVTYESYQILDSFQIPKKIIIIGIGYKATFTIKKLTFT